MPSTFTDPAVFTILAGITGLFVGSFLNVVIHRLPRMMEREWQQQAAELRGEATEETAPYNLAVPRSACPHCGHQISALENIPIVSYLILRGRCRHCSAPISPRYPVIEALCSLLSAYTAWHFGASLSAIAALLFVWTMLALSFIDIDTQLLPDSLTQPLLWLGLMVNLDQQFVPLPSAVIGAVAGYLSLWCVYWLFKLATGKEGMGYGDFKLLGAIGAWLGWQALPSVILLSSAVGAAIGVTLVGLSRQGRNTPLPFGPYLAAAGVIALFWGKSLTTAYLGLL